MWHGANFRVQDSGSSAQVFGVSGFGFRVSVLGIRDLDAGVKGSQVVWDLSTELLDPHGLQ